MVEALTEEHKQELSEVFKIFDEKGKGHLDVRELGACFRCFEYVATDADLQEQVVPCSVPVPTLSPVIPGML